LSTYYHPQPLNSGTLYLTGVVPDATLIFHDGIDLPCFAAFDLLKDATGTDRLREYYLQYIDLALVYGPGFVLESVTWRASPYRGEQLGYSVAALWQFRGQFTYFQEII
jgi:homocysteine S-methyltransferase